MARKEFTIEEGSGEEVKLAVRRPQYEDYEEADRVYAMKVSSLIKESGPRGKFLMRQDLDRYLRDQNIWSETDEKKIAELQGEIEKLLAELRKGGKKASEGRELAIKVMDKRKEIVKISSKKQAFDDITIESMAEAEKVDFLIYCSTVYSEDGKHYWDSFEDMKNDKLSQAYRKASSAAVEMIYNVNPEFEKNLPENRWLKKYNFIDENLNYTDRKTGEKVDRYGKPIKELKETVQRQFDNLQGEIKEEAPFIDDETNEPIVAQEKDEQEEKTETPEVAETT